MPSAEKVRVGSQQWAGKNVKAIGGGEERTALAVYIENLMGVPEKDSAHGAFLLSGESSQ